MLVLIVLALAADTNPASIEKLKNMLANASLSPATRAEAQVELAELLGTSESRESWIQARNLLSPLVEVPDGVRDDQEQWLLANVQLALGDREAALSAWTGLVKQFPASPYIPRTYLALGDFYAASCDTSKALTSYQRASDYPNWPGRTDALLHLAWIYYNVSERETALKWMEEAVAEASPSRKVEIEGERLRMLSDGTGTCGTAAP